MKQNIYVSPKVEEIFVASESIICVSMEGGDNGNGRPAQVMPRFYDYDEYYEDGDGLFF